MSTMPLAEQKNGPILSDLKKSELMEAFTVVDPKKEGSMTAASLGEVMRLLDPELDPSDEELRDLIKQVSPTGDTTLQYEHFEAFMANRLNTMDAEEEIAEAFKIFDVDSEGHVTSNGLKQVMSALGEDLTDHEVETMIKQWSSGNGVIDFAQFGKLMASSDD